MKILSLKLRIMVLWIFMAASITAEVSLYLYHKGQIESLISGEAGITSSNLVLWTIRWLIPFVLAFLTVSLLDKANRILNIVFGAIIVVFNIFQFVMRLIAGQYMPAFLIIIIVSSIIASILILLYAARWPKYGD
ncbi:MAG: hypothetical protein PHQ09_03630 [Actinomycetota bacterium]|jgi:hypothetical protein|nr:hypothetical protein [Actinomycetota bacterium]